MRGELFTRLTSSASSALCTGFGLPAAGEVPLVDISDSCRMKGFDIRLERG